MFHSPKRKNITLALQGGGSHGAFTWGVLDRLLEEDGLMIEGVSGTSAGAMNGALLVHGFAKGGAGAARRTLDSFWERLGSMSPGMPQRTFMGRVLGGLKISTSPGTTTGEILQRMFSLQRPHAHYVNPLRGLFEETVDIGAIRAYEPMKLFVAATDVESGRAGFFASGPYYRCPDGVGLPAVCVSGGRNRRQAVLGRRFHGQPLTVSAHRELRKPGHRHRAGDVAVALKHAPDAAGHILAHERYYLQCAVHQRTESDRFGQKPCGRQFAGRTAGRNARWN